MKLSVLEADNLPVAANLEAIDEDIVEKLFHRSKKNGLSQNSKATYRAVIRDFNRFLADNQLRICPESLKAYFAHVQPRYRVSTLNVRKYALMKIIKALFGENNILKTMAIEKVFAAIPSYQNDSVVPHDECLSEGDVQMILDATKNHRVKLMILFLFKTGCRVSEMINIRCCDCRDVNGYIKIQIVGKGNKAREVVIPCALYQEIHQTYGGKTWLFESRTGNRLDRSNIFVQIKKAGQKAGCAHLSPHMLRHARATDMLLSKNLSLKAVSTYLGHSSTAITADMYIHDEFDATALFAQDGV